MWIIVTERDHALISAAMEERGTATSEPQSTVSWGLTATFAQSASFLAAQSESISALVFANSNERQPCSLAAASATDALSATAFLVPENLLPVQSS